MRPRVEEVVGYEEISGNYRVWIPDKAHIEINRDIIFHENTFPETLLDLSQGDKTVKKVPACFEEAAEEEHDVESNDEKQPRYSFRNRGSIQHPIYVAIQLLRRILFLKLWRYQRKKIGMKK